MFLNNPTVVASEEVCLPYSRYLYYFELQYFYCEFSLIIGKYENMNKIDVQICAFIFYESRALDNWRSKYVSVP
jgi:hypothetical protein